MDNLLKFPSKDVRDWVTIEKTIREIYNNENLPSELIDSIIERFKPIWTKFNQKAPYIPSSIPFSGSPEKFEPINRIINTEISNVEKYFRGTINEALLEILGLITEIQTIKLTAET